MTMCTLRAGRLVARSHGTAAVRQLASTPDAHMGDNDKDGWQHCVNTTHDRQRSHAHAHTNAAHHTRYTTTDATATTHA